MKKVASYIFVSFFSLTFGVWFGYEKALNNQIYYDAPVKMALYNAVLEKGESEEFLKGALIQEIGLMEYMKDRTAPLLLNHPIHNGMEDAYNQFSENLDSLPQVIRAQEFIETYNKKRNEVDGSDEPPIR